MVTTIDWSKIDRHSITQDRVLLQRFADDYGKFFGNLNIGCRKCISEAYEKLINLKHKKMSQCDYRLKAKYEGTFFNDQPIRNGDLTNKLAKDILKNHPGGASLFDVIPDEEVKKTPTAKKVEEVEKVDEKATDKKAKRPGKAE